MKKARSCFGLSVSTLLLFLTLQPFVLTQEKGNPQKERVPKNLILPEKVLPAPERVRVGFEGITGATNSAILSFLASDTLEGRETGTRGYDTAAEFAGSLFSLWGLQPGGDKEQPQAPSFMAPPVPPKEARTGYLQQVEMKELFDSDAKALVVVENRGGKRVTPLTLGVDYLYQSAKDETLRAPVVFLGYGITEKELKYDDFKGLDLKGKWVMVLSDYPGMKNQDSPFNKGAFKEKYSSPARSMRGGDRLWTMKVKALERAGALGVLRVESYPEERGDLAKSALRAARLPRDDRPILPRERRKLSLLEGEEEETPWGRLPSLTLSRQSANILLASAGETADTLKARIDGSMKPSSFALPGVSLEVSQVSKARLVKSSNVLAFLEGSDPLLKEEVVVIGAHLDHLGKRGDYIYNGADDNGSGSTAVLAVARAMALNPVKPKRTILFALWTGEEEGLLGSSYYTLHPSFPLKKTVACLNLDMVSREWSKESLAGIGRFMGENLPQETLAKLETSRFAVFSLFDSPDLLETLRVGNEAVGLQMMLRPTKESFGGSDYAPFALKGIPWVFYFASMTEDYHQPGDEVDKISPSLMEKITRLVYLTAFNLADK